MGRLANVYGPELAKRALEIACAGGHNCLMKRRPGAGKTLLARALPSILPRLTLTESLDITRIYSVAGALEGAGRWPSPGEIIMAHRDILFLDELPESGSKNLGTLHQPLEDRVVTISRASGSLTFPADFILVAAMNPCPCGYFNDDRKKCTCSMDFV